MVHPTFILNGAFSADAIASLRKSGDAAALQQRIDAHVTAVGGQLDAFYFIAGDIRFTAIISAPRSAVSPLYYNLAASGLTQHGVLRLNRVRTDPADIDSELQAAASLGQPWPSANRAKAE